MPDLEFLADDGPTAPPVERPAWKILVVDDEPDVHRVTELILEGFRFRERPVVLIRADSAEAARRVLAGHSDIAMALVDVVMERRRAGLELVDHIRHELCNSLMRIVLRTGQPGDAPEQVVVRDYDISDYREKSGFGANQLLTVVRTNLATYEAMEQLERARSNLQALNEELVQFNEVVAHDLQGPIRNIHDFAGLLRRRHGAEFSEEAMALLAQIESSSDGMSQLVHELLTLSRIGRDERPLEIVDCNQVVDDACDNLRAQIDACGATIEKCDLPTVAGVRVYLVQLFQNLISNALKYNQSPTPHVRIAAREDNGARVLSVEDNGIGIDPDEMPRLLRPFRRGEGAKMADGTGIGLATCARIVDFLGGEIQLQSRKAPGSTILVRLPKQEVIADAR